MSVRHCATQGCSGTLPAGKGKHCPRCGGTVFLRPRRKGRITALIVLIALAAAAVGTFKLRSEHSQSMHKSLLDEKAAATPERRALMEQRELADQMTISTTRDDAYAQVIRRALAQHDFEYACQLGDEITISTNKDAILLETVEAALKENQPAWARHAAGQMVITPNRDNAFRKIMDAGSGK